MDPMTDFASLMFAYIIRVVMADCVLFHQNIQIKTFFSFRQFLREIGF